MSVAKSTEIRSLTGLRGIAAVYVVIYHYSSFSPGAISNVLHHGYIAVDLFFVLSGFVMAMTYGSEFRYHYNFSSHVRFLAKRLGRIYPVYVFITLLCAGFIYLGWQANVALDARTLWSNILLIQSWGLSDSLDGPAWSISTELAAYVLFPILATLILGRSWRLSWITTLASVCCLSLVAASSSESINQITNGIVDRKGALDVHNFDTLFPVIRCIAEFNLGIFAWRSVNVPIVGETFARATIQWLTLTFIIILLAVPQSDLLEVVLFVPLIMSLSTERSRTARLLSCTPVYNLGLISYSLYLVHLPVQQLSEPVVIFMSLYVSHAYSILGLILIGPVLALSALFFHVIEKPSRAWSRRILSAIQPVNRCFSETSQRPLESPHLRLLDAPQVD